MPEPKTPLRLRASRQDGGAHTWYQSSHVTKENQSSAHHWREEKRHKETNIDQRDQQNERQTPSVQTPLSIPWLLLRGLLHQFRWELPDVSRCREVHHRFIASFDGETLRRLHMLASARSLSRGLSHRLTERCLVIFPLTAVAEEMVPRLHHSASATTPIFIFSVSKLIQVRYNWCMPAF